MKRLHVAFIGEVDHGKSTLIGRLLLDTGSLTLSRRQAVESGAITLAHVVDQLGREQDQSMTVTSTEVVLRGAPKPVVLVDAPGHEQFLRHMLSGTSVAHAALLLLDATEGVKEETTRHAFLAKLLQIEQAAAVVNKLDCVPDPQAAFKRAVAALDGLQRTVGFALRAVVPASAQTGANVVKPGFSWWEGPTVLSVILGFESPDPAQGPVRFSVQDKYDFLPEQAVVGRVERGVLRRGAALHVLPGEEVVRVEALLDFPPKTIESLAAGFSGALLLDRPEAVRPGVVLVDPAGAPEPVTCFQGRIFCLGPRPIRTGCSYLLRCSTQEVEAQVEECRERLDSGTLRPLGPADVVEPLQVATLRIRTAKPVVVEPPSSSPALGRFVLQEETDIEACGMVVGVGP